MLGSLIRSTPLRVAVALSATFIIAIAIAGFLAWSLVGRELASRLDSAISSEFAVIGNTLGDNDLADLTDSVDSHVAAAVDHNRIYLLRNGETVLAGNIAHAAVPQGWSDVSAEALGLPGRDQYRAYLGSIGDYSLLVGASTSETEAVGRLLLVSLATAGAVLTAVLLAAGVFLTRAGQDRLGQIADVMGRVGQGQLDVRIPISRRGDDVDAVAQQVNGALDRLVGLVEGMRQVSVDIAHDLKTPLNRLSMAVGAATASVDETSRTRSLLAEAEEEIRYVNATFDALLRIAQIESGSRRSQFQQLDLRSTLVRLTEIYADVAEDGGQVLSASIADAPLSIMGDPELLTQLFANLIENAIRHGGSSARIRVEGRRERHAIVVEVSDNGPGIPAAEHEAVFTRLYRMERSRSTPGTGLGLSLAKAIVDLHGASITLGDNAPGLRVSVSFPAA